MNPPLPPPAAPAGEDETDVVARLRRHRPLAPRGDLLFERQVDGPDHLPDEALERSLTPAAVLVPLIRRPEGLTVLFTQRTAHLAHHPGQISFPGGRLEEGDFGDAVHAALRETEEEIGLSRRHVDIVAALDEYRTGTGFRVTPLVGLVQPPFELTLDAFEVADVFEVPLPFLLHRPHYILHRRTVEGRSRPYWAIRWQDRTIWGATAGMLVNLCDVLTAATVDGTTA